MVDREIMLKAEPIPITLNLSTTPESFEPYVCNLSPKLRKIAADELNEDNNIRTQALAQFREWIAKHPHIKKCRTDAPFLLRFLRTKKFSISAATATLEKFLAVRQLYPEWFQKMDIEDEKINDIISSGFLFPLPERDENGRSVIFTYARNFNHHKYTSSEMAKCYFLLYELLLDEDESQVAGYTYVYDASDSMGFFTLWSLTNVNRLIKTVLNAMPMRQKNAHFVNIPAFVTTFVNLLSSMFPEGKRNRVMVHKSFDELKDKIDSKILPKEYGGTMPMSEMIESFKDRLRKHRATILALDDMHIDITKDSAYVDNDDGDIASGTVGSFRKLEVD